MGRGDALGRHRPQPAPAGPGRFSLPAGESAQRYDLRVGESLDRGSGEVKDVIGEGEIRVTKPSAAKKK